MHTLTEGVLRALRGIQASVNAALEEAKSMAALQERLGPLLPDLQARRPNPSPIQQLDKEVQKLERDAKGLEGDDDDAKQAVQELQRVRLELQRVANERRQHPASSLALVGQFPLLLPDSEHFTPSLKRMLDRDGLDMGMTILNEKNGIKY